MSAHGKFQDEAAEGPATRAALHAFLRDLGIATATIEHPPLFTVEQSQALRGTNPGAHTKNLFLKDRKGRLFLVVAQEDARLDLKRLHEPLGASGRLSFGRPDEMQGALGVEPGSVTALAALNDRAGRVSVVLDAALMRSDRINCHPLVNTATTTIGRDDLIAFLRATGHEPLILDLPTPPAEL